MGGSASRAAGQPQNVCSSDLNIEKKMWTKELMYTAKGR